MSIKEAIKENTAIHCETEEEAKRILNMAHELGYKWNDGEKFASIDNNWDVYEKATCYNIELGMYDDCDCFEEAGYKIINSTDITDMQKESKKMNIKEAIKINTVIHCETESEANRILKMADELGYKWSSGISYTDVQNNWRFNEDETCYSIIDGFYGGIKYCNSLNFTIINSTDITDMTITTDWTPELIITPPSGYEIDEENSTFQKIVFRKIEPKFPTELEEIDRPWFIDAFGYIDESSKQGVQSFNHFTSKESAEQALEFIKLLAFRDAIWAIEGKPENEKSDVTFNFKTNEGLEHFEKMRKEIELGDL